MADSIFLYNPSWFSLKYNSYANSIERFIRIRQPSYVTTDDGKNFIVYKIAFSL